MSVKSDEDEGAPDDPLASFEWALRRAVVFVTGHLGLGLTEAIYRNALAIELRNHGFATSCEVPVPIKFCGEVIGMIRADIVCQDEQARDDSETENPIRIIELKVAARITAAHSTQARAYLSRASKGSTAYVVNFGPENVQWQAVSAKETVEACKRKREELENAETAT